MENVQDDQTASPLPEAAGEAVMIPPKYQKPDEVSNVWLKSVTSLAAYLLLGYFFFQSYITLLVITAIVMIHELGHFLAMRYFRYNDLGIFFIPLLGAYVSGTKREVSQSQSAVILLAGPLPGIIIGVLLILIDKQGTGLYFLHIPLYRIGLIFMLLNGINLLPVYPLDGGQLLNRVFLDEEGFWSKVFVFLSAGLIAWFAWHMYQKTHSPAFFLFFLFPLTMIFRKFGDDKLLSVEKQVEAAGIHTDVDYEELPDEDYWKIRNILIEHYPPFRGEQPAPPYTYSPKEDKIMQAVQMLLHRNLIQDVSVAGKILIFLVWAAALASPWLINIGTSLLQRFGF